MHTTDYRLQPWDRRTLSPFASHTQTQRYLIGENLQKTKISHFSHLASGTLVLAVSWFFPTTSLDSDFSSSSLATPGGPSSLPRFMGTCWGGFGDGASN